MNPELEAFHGKFLQEIRDRQEMEETVYTEEVFTTTVIDTLSEVGVISDETVLCPYDGNYMQGKIKISAYSMDENNGTMDLFISIFNNSDKMQTIKPEAVKKAARKAGRFFDGAARSMHQKMDPASEAAELARNISTQAKRIDRLRIFVLTDAYAPKKRIKDMETNDFKINYEIWDLERLQRARDSPETNDIFIDFKELSNQTIPCLKMPSNPKHYEAYLAIFPAEVLYNLYDKHGPRLLEMNVRSFLSARGKVNKGIRQTLQEEPENFMAYNNGIVITVDQIEMCEDPMGQLSISTVRGMQIVNGGQTTASIHHSRKKDKADVSAVYVPAKIAVIREERLEDMVKEITRNANSQNTVQQADFAAGDPFHRAIERRSRETWTPDQTGQWFYERARGQYQGEKSKEATTPASLRKFNERIPPNRKITKTDLAKYMNAWSKFPHIVARGTQKNFASFMLSIATNPKEPDNPKMEPDVSFFKDLVAKAILYRNTHRIVRQEKFPAHKANIEAYTVALLSEKYGPRLSLKKVWAAQSISGPLSEIIRKWSHVVDRALTETAAGRMVSEWAKKEDCWKKIREIELEMPDNFPPEIENDTSLV